MLYKVYATIAVAFGARGCEAADLQWENFRRLTDENTALRLASKEQNKLVHQASTESPSCFVKGELEILSILNYMSCFKVEETKGNHYNYLIILLLQNYYKNRSLFQAITKNQKIDATNFCIIGQKLVIGKHTLANYYSK